LVCDAFVIFVVVLNNGVVGKFCALDETSFLVYVLCDVQKSVFDEIFSQAVVVKE
jgi:hypothetical protein